MQLLGAFINPMGDRVATGLAATVIGPAGGSDSYYPVTGGLVTETPAFLTTEGGDHIIYATN